MKSVFLDLPIFSNEEIYPTILGINYGKLNSYIEVQGQVTSVLAGAFAAILLTGSYNNTLEIAGFSFYVPLTYFWQFSPNAPYTTFHA